MIETEDNEAQKQALAGTEYGINEALLQSEIEFWREMIDSCELIQTAESLERMSQAMALAETKLSNLFETYRKTGRAGARRSSNVYSLDDRRKQFRSR